MQVKVNIYITAAGATRAFLIRDEEGSFPEVIGVGRSLPAAVADYAAVQENLMKYWIILGIMVLVFALAAVIALEFIDPEALAVGVQVRMKLPVYYRQLYAVKAVRDRLPSLFQEAGVRGAVEALTRGGGSVPSIMQWTEANAAAIKKNYTVNPNRFFAPYTRAFGSDFRRHAQSVSDFLYRRMEYLEKLWAREQ